MKILHNNLIKPETPVQDRQESLKPGTPNFKEVLSESISKRQPLQFSKHADLRLNSRNINLTKEQLNRVEDGITAARAKGIRDSLVLVDNIALVVNVKSKTVITAMNNSKEQVYTNIDGAVIV